MARSWNEPLGVIKRDWIAVVVILVGVGVFAAFRLTRKTEAEYFTAKVEQGDIRQVIEATGTINPVTLVQVGSQEGQTRHLGLPAPGWNAKIAK